MSLLDAAQGVLNATSPLPWLVVSGQPTADQLKALQGGGARTVIDVRDSMEPRDFDEPATTTSLGMTYVNAPVVSGALTDASMSKVLDALRTAKGTPTLMHCNSANRTGGPLIAYLMLEEKLDENSAVDAAMRAGLRSVELIEWAVGFAQRAR